MRKILVILISLSFLLACGKEAKRPNEDAQLAVEAFGVAEGLRDAYVSKSFTSMRKFCTEDGYETLIRDIKKFRAVELQFTPRWVDIRADGTIYVNISWEGKWTLEDTVKAERGMGVFQFTGRPLKLSAVIRANPFVQPEPLAVPGLNGNR